MFISLLSFTTILLVIQLKHHNNSFYVDVQPPDHGWHCASNGSNWTMPVLDLCISKKNNPPVSPPISEGRCSSIKEETNIIAHRYRLSSPDSQISDVTTTTFSAFGATYNMDLTNKYVDSPGAITASPLTGTSCTCKCKDLKSLMARNVLKCNKVSDKFSIFNL